METGEVRTRKNCTEADVTVDIEQSSGIPVKPRLRLLDGVVFILGVIIGSGIFVSPKGALQYSGSVGLSLVIWAVCGGMSVVFTLVYAELGVMLPRSGGDFTYIKEGIGPPAAFLVSWIQTLITSNGALAVLALVFADYLCAPFFGNCGPPNSVRKMIAALKIVTIASANILSVRLVARLQRLFTALKVTALLSIAVGGVVNLCKGKFENLHEPFKGTTHDVSSIGLAVYSCMWAYSGFQHLNEIAEELRRPKKVIPRASLLSLLIVISLYLLANVSYYIVLPKAEFLSAPAVAYVWAEKVFGPAAFVIPIGVACSVFGASNGGMLSYSRMRFAAARAGHLPEVLSFLHHRTRIPLAAICINTLLILVMLIPGDVGQIINLTSFAAFTIVGFSMLANLRLRTLTRKYRKDTDFRLPAFVPVLGFLLCVFMVVAPLVHDPRPEILYGLLIIAAGLVVYVPLVHFRLVIPGLDHVTTCLQLLLDICPTVEESQAKLQLD